MTQEERGPTMREVEERLAQLEMQINDLRGDVTRSRHEEDTPSMVTQEERRPTMREVENLLVQLKHEIISDLI